MKPNKFKVSIILFLKSGITRKVDWIEDTLMKKVVEGGRETNAPLELREAEGFFQGKFKEWKEQGATIVRKNVLGDNSLISFNEVDYATFSIEQLKVEKEVVNEGIENHPAHPSRYN